LTGLLLRDPQRQGLAKVYAYLLVVILVVASAAVIGVAFRPELSNLGAGGSGGAPAVNKSTGCVSVASHPVIFRSKLTSITFGSVTKFSLPSPLRAPNAVTVASDGSVWFGEQGLPGVGHLFQNGTLVEYQWPFNYLVSGGDCSTRTSIWGIALWGGRVWATDTTGNQLVGLNPANDTITTVKLSSNSSFPYAITIGPGNDHLWFTELYSSKLGRLSPNGSLTEYPIMNGSGTPTQIAFVNSSLGYLVMTGGVPGRAPAGVFSFDPQRLSSSPPPQQVGGNMTLYSPDSVSLGDGGIWLAQHGGSSVTFYDLSSHSWTIYPTSTVSYIDTTLPYFVSANGSQLWFNEHYANRMADLDYSNATLTEYSLADPPIINGTQIQNALTFAVGNDGRVWFTEWTANYVGFVDTSVRPQFSLGLLNSAPYPTIRLLPGGTATVMLRATGRSSNQPMSMQFSDSEAFTSIPQNITFSSNASTISSFSGSSNILVTLKASSGLRSGNYTAALTLNGGLVSVSVYVRVEVG
jgi:streptogramin lyase